MDVSVSGTLANAAVLGAVPAAIILAYLGHLAGLYPYWAVPFVIGGGLVVVFALLLILLPRIRAVERPGPSR